MINRTSIGLIVSLTLNVFLIGVGIGVLVTGARITPGGARARPLPNVWVAAQALPQLDRYRFRSMLREKAVALQPQLKAVRMARREAAALIAEPNFDANAVSAAMERARAGETAARSEFDQAFIAYLATMPQKERADLADAMVRAGPGNVRAAIRADDGAGKSAPQGQPPAN